MTLVADVKTRIAPITALRAVDEAADLSALIKAGQLPQQTPCAYVVPLGFNAGTAEAVTGLYRQAYEPVIGVVLVIQTVADAKARKALASIDAIEQSLFEKICGWAPDGATGVFRALRGRLISVADGLVIYQLDFALQDQLRIST